jgi:hypothetical protein
LRELLMLEPYSLEEVVRAEIDVLYPGSQIGRPLPHEEEEAKADRGVLTRTREGLALLRRDWTEPKVEREPGENELPQALAEDLFRQKLTALCFSGGGIRSASFCLGVLEALAERRLFTGFDYLSTVSGGGYIGGWVTAWGSRNGWNMAGVQERLASRSSPKQVENLREFTNYLTPRAGLMSADTWVGVATIARNLVLNWSLFLPLFLLTVAVPKFVAALFEGLAQRPELQPGAPDYVSSVKWMLIGAGILYGFAELFISKEILETQSEKNTEDVGREAAKTAAETNPEKDRKTPRPDPQAKVTSTNDFYGQGNVVSALVIVVFVAAAACVATGVLTRMQLQLTTENFLFFGVAGATVWLTAFLVACVAIMRLRRSPARAIPVTAIMETTRQDLIKLTAARTIGGAAFGAMLLVGFHLLGGLVQTTSDDRYAVVIGLLIFIVAHLAGGTVFFCAQQPHFAHGRRTGVVGARRRLAICGGVRLGAVRDARSS